MKNLIIVSFIIFIIVSGRIYSSDWNWQNPYPACVKFISVKSINVNVVYACGEAGAIAKTTNGGVNWFMQNSGTSYNLNKVEFINENTGWCVGGKDMYSVIIKTTNGGLNWSSQLSPNDTSYILQEVKFQNENTGWAGGGYYSGRSTLLKTTNSGVNWIRVPTGTNLWVYSIEFITSQTGFVSGMNFVIRTTDAGVTWNQLGLPLTTYNDMEFIDGITGWLCGNSLYKTVNSGTNWTSVFATGLNCVDFVSPDSGFATNQSTTVRKTTNGGHDWILVNTGYTENMLSVSFANSSTGWSVGWYGQLVKTTNAGENWISQKVDQIPGDINDICMQNNKLWIVTKNVNNTGAIYSSSDMGNTWNQDLYLPVIFTSVNFTSNDTGWALGYAVSGNQLRLFRTVNAGINWELHSTLPYFLSTGDILFINSQTGFLTGSEWPGGFGRIFKTTNSGINWANVGGGERVNDIK
ncbi:MAG TPA: YCF48-related protein, partial [Ignavibacteria bacterium]|nr:YCF48-related protein [Ignavibacteria bacterium]